jgi:hypothetical protein
VHITVSTVYLQKHGNTAEEYEDAFYPRGHVDTEAWYFRAAIADGATETSFAREWANDLATGFCRRRFDPHRLADTLGWAQRRWKARVASLPLAWYAQEKAGMGAFSTLVGLTILEASRRRSQYAPDGVHDGRWTAVAVGDSCLIQVRDGAAIAMLPLTSSAEFSSRPALISSLVSANRDLDGITSHAQGEWRSGDRFLLLTDAIAHWLLNSLENGQRGLAELESATATQEIFSSWVAALRTSHQMRNDDTTVMTVRIQASPL